MDNTEIIENAVEETVTENVVENAVAADPTFAQKHPVLYVTGLAALFGGATMAGAYIVDGVVGGGRKVCKKIRNKIADRKAEKAKKIEVVTVEKND